MSSSQTELKEDLCHNSPNSQKKLCLLMHIRCLTGWSGGTFIYISFFLAMILFLALGCCMLSLLSQSMSKSCSLFNGGLDRAFSSLNIFFSYIIHSYLITSGRTVLSVLSGKEQNHKFTLYSDDLLLYMSKTATFPLVVISHLKQVNLFPLILYSINSPFRQKYISFIFPVTCRTDGK